MKKTIVLDGKERSLESNALLPRVYRKNFGRDLIVDMRKMAEQAKTDPDGINMETLENVTWLMLKAAGEDVGETPEEWLVSLDDSLAVYFVMNDVVELWLSSQKTTSTPKKK